MLHHIKLLPFSAGIIIGLFMLFFYNTPPVIVYEYPHPQNINNSIFKDKNSVCYTYKANEVNCDAHEATLKQYPLQG